MYVHMGAYLRIGFAFCEESFGYPINSIIVINNKKCVYTLGNALFALCGSATHSTDKIGVKYIQAIQLDLIMFVSNSLFASIYCCN